MVYNSILQKNSKEHYFSNASLPTCQFETVGTATSSLVDYYIGGNEMLSLQFMHMCMPIFSAVINFVTNNDNDCISKWIQQKNVSQFVFWAHANCTVAKKMDENEHWILVFYRFF